MKNMTIPDTAVEAALDTWRDHEFDGTLDYPRMRNALTAALPFLQGVKVKDLTWYDMPGISTAHDNNPRYCAVKTHNGKGVFSWSLEIHGLFSDKYDTLEAAKAAAQADYEARTLSAIEAGETIETYYARQIEWSKKTFGPALRTLGILDHIRKELKEIEAEPHDLSEWIDVVILAMDGFWRHGGSVNDIMPRLLAKQQKNMARDWPDWRNMSEDSAIEHDRTKDADPSPCARAFEEAAKFVDKQVSDYVQEHGVTDPETGTVEFRGWGDEYVSELEELAEGIRALSSQPVADGWLPIETAPKDETEIWGWSKTAGGSQTLFLNGEWLCVDWNEDGYINCTWEPTHWRPLPASPGASE